MATIEPFGLPPAEAIKWFESKGYKLGFDWRDTWRDEHAWAFTVAKAMQLDLLGDIRGALDDALREGTTLQDFIKRLRPVLQEKGWWGEKEVIDPETGEKKLAQLGSPRRLRTIYDTNLRQAHSAGQWQRFERLAQARPYLRYIARGPGPTRRAEHQAFHNQVHRVDAAIWRIIMPMNGWGCKCGVHQLSERDLKRYGLTVSEPLELKYRNWENKRTGEVMRVPVGIDPGFDHNPGLGRRGFTPPSNLPPLDPVRSADEYGRPRALDVAARADAPAPFDRARSAKERARLERDFAKLFGVQPGHAGRATDPTGAQVEFPLGMLDYLTAKREGRERFLPHAKLTVEQPYEVWLMPHRRKDGSVVLRKRYIGLFKEADDKQRDLLVVVEEGGAFTVYPRDGIDAQRRGYLLYPATSPAKAVPESSP